MTPANAEYEASDFADFQRNHTGHRLDTASLSTSHNIVLTALAQLGVCQTKAQRALISLFDVEYEYIIAEATACTPLAPRQSAASCPEPLWFCGTAMPRHHWVGEQVLNAVNGHGPTYNTELPLFLVDMASDAHCAAKPICRSLAPGLFYAAVPIRTFRGINIGTYCVLSSNGIETWDDRSTKFLRGISHAIMEHLEGNRIKSNHRRNVRVSRGLGSFLEGKSTLSGWQAGPNSASFLNRAGFEGALDPTQQQIENEDRDEDTTEQPSSTSTVGFDVAHNNPASSPLEARNGVLGPIHAISSVPSENILSDSSTVKTSAVRRKALKKSASGINGVYAKAANIIREALEVSGCVFYDVTVGSYRRSQDKSTRDDDNLDSNSQFSLTSSSDDNPSISPLEDAASQCQTLGFSTSDVSSINLGKLPQNEGVLPKAALAKLLRRYPNGKIFSFDAIGELQYSDVSEDDSTYKALSDEISSAPTGDSADGSASTAAKRKQASRSLRRVKEGALIQKAFPGARSVAFMPVWDVKQERWFSANFIYTLTPTRAFTLEAELSNLNVFAKLIATEIHNLETLQSNQAKSDALGSLSHELRSPLHGIILGAELLNNTGLSVFQSNAAYIIETCCRTLLDTVDHLLDYSKINSFAEKRKGPTMGLSPANQRATEYNQFGKKRLYANTSIDAVLEEVIESVFAGHSFQRRSIQHLAKNDTAQQLYTTAHTRSDSSQAMEQLGPGISSAIEDATAFGDVLVNVSIDPDCDWLFNVQVGAIRRIIMNLFGNSLKYTKRGTILVSLEQQTAATKRSSEERIVKLVVQDTGKGISHDYLQHKLLKPFSQEDELASGTGLGLSFVKTVVTQEQGRISVKSQVGIGTTITVKLPLEQAYRAAGPSAAGQMAGTNDDFHEQRQDLKGLRVKFVGFESGEEKVDTISARDIVQGICRDWLHMDMLVEKPSASLSSILPDVVIWSYNGLPQSFEDIAQLKQTPNVVICPDAGAAYQRFTRYQTPGDESGLAFISQPFGPRKLAKTLHLAYRRWMGVPKLPSQLRPSRPVRSHSSSGNWSAQSSGSLQRSPTELSTGPARVVTTSTLQVPLQAEAAMPPFTSDLIKNKLLLVDDNSINVKVLSAYIAKLGLPYETASNGKEAVDTYTECPDQFAGILMDISMPVMNGFEATREIRAHEHAKKIPRVAILALTGLASESAQREALESGVDVFLTKPVRLETLSDSLASMSISQTAAPGEGSKYDGQTNTR